jgi:hypothetical protein
MDDNDDFISKVHAIREFKEICEFLDDPEVDKALGYVLKLCEKPDIPPVRAKALVMQLQAYSANFHTRAAFYKTIGAKRAGTPEAHKKNLYYNLVSSLNDLVAALKYLTRPQGE